MLISDNTNTMDNWTFKNKYFVNSNCGGIAQRLERRACDREVAESMPVLGNTLLCPWKRHLTQIS